MTDFHSNFNGTVSAQANEWQPTSNQRDMRVVVNPVGLPASTYLIWYDVADPSSVLAQAMFALNLVTLDYYVRVPAAPPVTWSAWSQINGGVAAGVTSFNGRVGVVVPLAGDYTDAQITNTSTVPGATVFDTENYLNANKVTYFPADAAVASDILVNVGGGNDYHASGTDLRGRIGALAAGQPGSVTQTTNGAVIEATGSGAAIPTSSLIRATLDAAGSGQGNFSCVLADSSADAAFGQGGNQQSNHRAIMALGLPAAIGGNGAYAFSLDVAGTKPFFVNAVGNVFVTLTAGPAVSQLGIDANGMICAFP